MANERASDPEFESSREDVPESLVIAALNRLRRNQSQRPHRVPEWEVLKNDPDRRGYVAFIERASTLIAPEDSVLRGQVSTALLEMYFLTENAAIIGQLCAEWGVDASQLFGQTTGEPPVAA
jgi:hypothetical protein